MLAALGRVPMQAHFDHPEPFVAHGSGGNEELLDCMVATPVPVFTPEDEERALGFRPDACEHIERIPAVGRSGAVETISPFVTVLEGGL